MSYGSYLLRHCLRHRIGVQVGSVGTAKTLSKISQQHGGTHFPMRLHRAPRHFSTSANYARFDQTEKEKILVRVFEQGQTLPHQQWNIRMNNQNGYLSWCRNSYLCLSIGIAVSMSPMFLAHYESGKPCEVGEELYYILTGAAALGMCNMIFGATEFIYQMFKTRPLTQVSWVTVLVYTTFAIIHCLLFCDFARSFMNCFDCEEKHK